jgi:hypothetical protein
MMVIRYVAVVALIALGCSSSSAPASPKKPSAAGHAGSGAGNAKDAGAARDGSTTGDAGAAASVTLPGAMPGIGFDDLQWARGLRKVLAPAGRSGNLDLIDPDTLAVDPIGGFSMSDTFAAGSHSAGTTSAIEANGTLYAVDHETQSVEVVDPATRKITASGSVTGGPDYVRFVEQTSELWVTQPFTGIDVLSVPASGGPEHAATIAVMNGPEAIVVDAQRKRVYTNSFTGQTYAIDIASREIVETWPNGCALSLGLALDEQRGFVFVACAAGSIVVLDVANAGNKLGELQQGAGLDVLSYDPGRHHLYVQGSMSADLGIVGISAAGKPTLLGTVPTAMGSSTSTTDENGHVFVADPAAGALMRITDQFAKTE